MFQIVAFRPYKDIPLVTALPSNPNNGDEIVLTDSLSAGTYHWHFRYVAARSSNKWVFVGGTPLVGETATSETRTNTAYGDLSGGATGPSITLPVAGDYVITHGLDGENGSAAISFMSYDIGASGAVDADGVRMDIGNAGSGGSFMRSKKKTGLTAVALTSKYKVSTGTMTALNRFIQALPIAVGG